MFTKLWAMTVGVFFISLISATTPAASVILKELPIQNKVLVWGLAVGGVSDQLNTGNESVLPQNYTIEVKAGAKDHNFVPEDQVHLTLTTFLPNSGVSEGQGRSWFIQDSQVIIEKGINAEAIKVRYNP